MHRLLLLVAILHVSGVARAAGAREPIVQIDTLGNSVFAYHVEASTDRRVTSRDLSVLNVLSSATVISRANWFARDVQMLMDGSGNVIAIWIESNSNDSKMVLYAAKKGSLGAWQEATALSDENNDVVSVAALDVGGGRWGVVFASITTGTPTVFERHSTFAGAWSAAITLA